MVKCVNILFSHLEIVNYVNHIYIIYVYIHHIKYMKLLLNCSDATFKVRHTYLKYFSDFIFYKSFYKVCVYKI